MHLIIKSIQHKGMPFPKHFESSTTRLPQNWFEIEWFFLSDYFKTTVCVSQPKYCMQFRARVIISNEPTPANEKKKADCETGKKVQIAIGERTWTDRKDTHTTKEVTQSYWQHNKKLDRNVCECFFAPPKWVRSNNTNLCTYALTKLWY